VRSGRIAFPKVAPRTAAFRVVMNVSVPENGGTTTVPLTFHVVALGHGRGEAGIMTIGSGNTTSLENVRVLAQVTGRRLAAANL
jgi:hypothetical protein